MAKKKAKTSRKKIARASKKKVTRRKTVTPKRRPKARRAAGRKPATKTASRTKKRAPAKKSAAPKKRATARKRATPKKAATRKPAARAKAPTKPKRPRRTMQAMPPVRTMPAPESAPMMPVSSAPPPPAPIVDTEAVAAPPMPNVGDLAPDFVLLDENGLSHSLSQHHGRKVVLYFYPKDDTPGCTTEACGFRNALGAISDRGAAVLGLSPDSADSHRRFRDKFGLTFPLLVDEGHAVADKYGVWRPRNRYGEMVMGIERTTFIIDANGRVARVFRNVRPEGHEQEVLAAL